MIRRKNSSPCARSASTSSPIAERAQGDEFFRRIIRSEEHTSELQSHLNLVCRLLLEKKKKKHSDARKKRRPGDKATSVCWLRILVLAYIGPPMQRSP